MFSFRNVAILSILLCSMLSLGVMEYLPTCVLAVEGEGNVCAVVDDTLYIEAEDPVEITIIENDKRKTITAPLGSY